MKIPNGTVLVDFWAEWCGPCKMIAKDLTAIENEVKDLTVLRLNVDEVERSILIEYGVQSIPTLILLQDGVEVKRVVGAAPKAAIMSELGLAAMV